MTAVLHQQMVIGRETVQKYMREMGISGMWIGEVMS